MVDILKPYLAFAGYRYYPGGGTADFVGAFATLEEAKAAVAKHAAEEWEGCCWWLDVALFDGETLTSVYSPGWNEE